MRVLIDAGPLLGPQSGVGSFTGGLLGALAAIPEIDAAAYATTIRGRRTLTQALPTGVQLRNVPVPGRVVSFAWRRFDGPPVEWVAGRCAVVHGTNYVVPPSRRPRVVTVHDMSPVRYPELCDAIVRSFPDRIRRALEGGAFVHTHSPFVADEIAEHFGVPRDRVAVVASGVPRMTPTARPEVAEEVQRKGSYILAVGTVEPRKDYTTLVRAFEQLAPDLPDVRLVIVGRAANGYETFADVVSRSPVSGRIEVLGYASPELLGELLRRAEVLAYPSLYEGFGYPPLQAMAAGVPVVTTDAGAIPGTVGDAATLVPVGDVDSMAGALGRLIDGSDSRAELIARGRSRAALYSWERCGREMASLYARIVDGGS